MDIIKYYFNLTNGLEALNHYNLGNNVSLLRIQSTWCEQKLWDNIIQDLDYNFLIDAALGHEIIIFDYSAKKKIPRSLYQGLQFILYVLNRIWFNKNIEIYIKEMNCTKYFQEVYNNLQERSKSKINYCKKFLCCNELNIKFNADNSNCESRINKVIDNFKRKMGNKNDSYICNG